MELAALDQGGGIVRQCEDWDVVMCNDCWLY